MKTFIYKNYSIAIFLILLMVLGLILRTYYLNQNNIVFGYDQARDAYIASQITQGDLKILGPPVSLGGFYHGVFYYYFIALPYLLSRGNPILPIIFISVFSISVIPLVFYIGKNLFNIKVGILSAIFYTISFDLVQYSNWLSNPSLAVPCSVILFYGLYLFFFTPKKNAGSFLTALGYGLCFQSQFFLGYLIVPIIFSVFYLKIKPTKKQFLIFITTFLFTISTMILSYFKFGFTFIDGFKNMFSGKDIFNINSYNFFDTTKLVLTRLIENFSRVLFPFNPFYAFIIYSFCFVFFLKNVKNKTVISNKLSLFWIFILSQIIILPFGGISTPHVNVGLQLPLIIAVSVYLSELSKNKPYISYFLIVIIITSSFFTSIKSTKYGSLIFSIQKPLTLKNEIETIQYTYQDSNGQPFSINTITSPFWVNTLWSYIYQQYGQNKYNYLPSFHGRDQIGRLGDLPTIIDQKTKNFYLIIEPDNGIPPSLIEDTIAYEDSFSQILETKNFNGILVQKRQLILPLEKINFVK